jgi:hypothetical protein
MWESSRPPYYPIRWRNGRFPVPGAARLTIPDCYMRWASTTVRVEAKAVLPRYNSAPILLFRGTCADSLQPFVFRQSAVFV